MITSVPERLQIPKGETYIQVFAETKKSYPYLSSAAGSGNAMQCSQKMAVEMLKKVFDNC